MTMNKLKIDRFVPFAILILMGVVFAIATQGSILASENLENIFNQTVPTIIAGLGMIYVVAMGGTDITYGSLLAVSAAIGGMAAEALGTFWMIPIAILIGMVSGLILGVVNAKFKVPSFMASLAILIAFRAYLGLLLNSKVIMVPMELRFIDQLPCKIIILIILVGIISYIFNYTPFGVYVKSIGENENALKYVGINVEKVKIFAFMISGIMASIAGIFMFVRVGGVDSSLGSGFEMKVMMAMFIGGIPVEGGMETKIYKLIVGAPTIVILENGLVLCGASGGFTQLIRAIVLLLSVYITLVINKKFNESKNKSIIKNTAAI